MRIRVVSDGTIPGTKAINADTGELVEGVARVIIYLDSIESPYAEITVNDIQFDIISNRANVFNTKGDSINA